MSSIAHLTAEQLDAGTAHVLAGPREAGTVDMIVRRPDVDEREVLDQGELIVGEGLAGDNYLARGSKGGPANPEAQLNLMSTRAIELVAAGDRDRWALAGDQFFVDLDLTVDNLPAGTRLRIGTATIEVSQKPHTGCAKFGERFGIEAARWANEAREQRRRGLCAMVVEAGTVRTGDAITVLR